MSASLDIKYVATEQNASIFQDLINASVHTVMAEIHITVCVLQLRKGVQVTTSVKLTKNAYSLANVFVRHHFTRISMETSVKVSISINMSIMPLIKFFIKYYTWNILVINYYSKFLNFSFSIISNLSIQ